MKLFPEDGSIYNGKRGYIWREETKIGKKIHTSQDKEAGGRAALGCLVRGGEMPRQNFPRGRPDKSGGNFFIKG